MKTISKKYKAAKLIKGKVVIETLLFPKEKLHRNSLVIKPIFIGICRADVKEVIGSRDIMWDRGPLFGHELIGTIVYAGDKTGFKEGKLITFNPNVTPNRTTGFAEYFFIEGNRKELVSAIIAVLDKKIMDSPWMPEPLACVVHSIEVFLRQNDLGDLKNKSIGIIGAGNSGMLFGLLAKHLGAVDVVLFNRGQMRIDFAENNQLFSGNELQRLNNYHKFQNLFDVVIVVPTAIDQKVLQIAYRIVKKNGYLHLYGGTRKGNKFLDSGVDIDAVRRKELFMPLNYKGKKLILSGAYGCTKKDFEKAFALYRDYPIAFPLPKMTSEIISLEELPLLIMSMASNKADYPGKVLVKNNV